jgi:hypothetical protein
MDDERALLRLELLRQQVLYQQHQRAAVAAGAA